MAGLGNIAGSPFWDYIPISRWAFDILYIGLGRSMNNIPLLVFINLLVAEVLLYIFFIYKERKKPNSKENNTL